MPEPKPEIRRRAGGEPKIWLPTASTAMCAAAVNSSEITDYTAIIPFSTLRNISGLRELDVVYMKAESPEAVPGVVEVNSYGGEAKSYQVTLDADKLTGYNLSLDQVFDAIEANNSNSGGAYIERSGEQLLIRGEGLVTNLDRLDVIQHFLHIVLVAAERLDTAQG